MNIKAILGIIGPYLIMENEKMYHTIFHVLHCSYRSKSHKIC